MTDDAARLTPAGALRWLAGAVLLAGALALVVHGVRLRSADPVASGVGLVLIARGAVLGRRLVAGNVIAAAALLLAAVGAARVDQGRVTALLLVTGAFAVVRPAPPPPPASAGQRQAVAALVERTPGDPIAPFAQRSDKSYVFTPDGGAAVAYRVRFGTAVASGDPVGSPRSADAAVAAFEQYAARNGWRVAVLGTAHPRLWGAQPGGGLSGRRAVGIGRDVVLDVAGFDPVGRRARNLRQAVQRTRNAGVSTGVLVEDGLDPALRAEVAALMTSTRGLAPRGFSMILDHPLDGTHPGTLLALARDRAGRLVAVHRFALADGGRQVCLDVPWRAPGAPNGVDERLALDMLGWARQHGGEQVSLAFAPFSDLFAGREHPGPAVRVGRVAVHALDRLIRVEALYRYLRKFDSFGARRYVVLAPAQVFWAGAAMLSLEFGAGRPGARDRGRRRLSPPGRCRAG